MAMCTCTLLPSNQSYWQLTSQEKGGAVSGVGHWRGTVTEYKQGFIQDFVLGGEMFL